MSRKHPGKAIEYGFKRELHKVKEIERNRRKYFKFLENEVKLEHKEKWRDLVTFEKMIWWFEKWFNDEISN